MRHVVHATIDLAQQEITVLQDLHFRNLSALPLTELLLLVEANRKEGSVTVQRVVAGDTPLRFTLEGRKLSVRLPRVLQPEDAMELTLAFRLDVPPFETDDFLGWLGYSQYQMNLGNWLPVVAPWGGGQWLVNETTALGEHSVQDTADWQVYVDIENAPDDVVLAGPGQVTEMENGRWQIELQAARDFSLSVGSGYQHRATELADGTILEVYSLNDAPDALAAAAWTLDVARRSMERFAALFGPIPFERLVVVEGDFPDGMEFSGLVFVSRDWFESWEGNPASYLTLITAHEVAHQWWYGSVGSDQAREPWLDEALATYSEYLLLESDFPDLLDWWWEWRVDRFAPGGHVDSDIYEFARRRDYINAVYLRGARMLHELRQDLGDDAFFGWLRRHAEQGAGNIVTEEDFWSLLSESQRAATLETRRRYLRDPGP
ncbi:MAG: M1 family aminopeptidase [Anaerolineaceae bacterium]|nr:M1 family aminopeptidase [Anaerolineaceae bacterium]MDE0330022.1 M1 family aminopeptidase [Anaerolineaceae bacterium]